MISDQELPRTVAVDPCVWCDVHNGRIVTNNATVQLVAIYFTSNQICFIDLTNLQNRPRFLCILYIMRKMAAIGREEVTVTECKADKAECVSKGFYGRDDNHNRAAASAIFV